MTRLRSTNHVDAIDDIVTVDLTPPTTFTGQTTRIVKRNGPWAVVVKYGEVIARLEKKDDAVNLLALPTGWVVLA